MNTMVIVILGLALLLLLVYLFHNRIIRVVARLTDIFFYLGFVILVSLVVFPDFYLDRTDRIVHKTYLGTQLTYADSSLNKLDSMRVDFMKKIPAFLGGIDKEQVIIEPFELYAGFSTFIGYSAMTSLGLICLFAMLMGIYFKYTFIGYLSASRGETEMKKFKNRLIREEHDKQKNPN